MSVTNTDLANVFKNVAFAAACQVEFEDNPNYQEVGPAGVAKLIESSILTPETTSIMTQLGIKHHTSIPTLSKDLEKSTLDIYGFMLLGAEYAVEFGNIHNLSAAELEELVDETP